MPQQPSRAASASAHSTQKPIKSETTKTGGRIDDHGKYKIEYDKSGNKLKVITDSGKVTSFGSGGRISEIKRGDTKLKFHDDGGRTVMRGDKVHYVESAPKQVGNKTIVTRKYEKTINNNTTQVTKNYHSHNYGGYTYHSYVPIVAYDPWVYDWVFYNPWRYRPYSYRWGWWHDPWYDPYRYYFSPFDAYHSPSLWLTDYLLGSAVRDHHENQERQRQDAAYTDGFQKGVEEGRRLVNNDTTPVSEEVKKQIAVQVEEALQSHKKQEAVPLVAILNDTKRIFPVKEDLEVSVLDQEGKICSLTSGDLIRIVESPGEDEPVVKIVVVTSKKGSCPPGTRAMVSVEEIQDMQNNFVERIEEGAQKMKDDKVAQQNEVGSKPSP